MKAHRFLRHGTAGLALLGACSISAAAADPIADFYAKKQIVVTVGQAPGGGFDAYARLAGRFIGQQIPGNPSVIVQNRPGAGGVSNANYVYNIAPRDGTVLTIPNHTAAAEQLLGSDAIKYDARKFNWVGRFTSTVSIHYMWHTSKIKSIDDVFKYETIVAGQGASSTSSIYPALLNKLFGTKFKIITGFTGASLASLAMQRGEVDGMMTPWSGVKLANPDWIRDKQITVILQYAMRKHPDLPDVPLVLDLAKTDEQREILTFYATTHEIGRSLATTPEVPEDRVAALRAAFMSMTKTKEFQQEVEKQNIEIGPMDGAELQKVVNATFDISPATIEKLREFRTD